MDHHAPYNLMKEPERLAALRRYAILDTPPEQAFDDIAQMAAQLLNCPMAAVSLVDETRQWFKAEVGIGVRETPLCDSVCRVAILQNTSLVVPDTKKDDRFASNTLVHGDFGLRFYAGELLITPDGHPIGALCVLDTKPRPEGITPQQRFFLNTLATQVISQLELRHVVAAQEKILVEQRHTEARLRLEQDRSQRAEALANGQRKALEMAVMDAPLPAILDVLVHSAEEQMDRHVMVSILLLDEDGKHLRKGSAPSLPEAYNNALDGTAIGPSVGSCGTAAFLQKAVTVSDIEHDPLWREYRELALSYGLRSCWSQPIFSPRGKVLGTLAVYRHQIHEPQQWEVESMALLVNTAALILDHRRQIEEHKRANQRKDEFLAMLAHELRNPMAPIRAAADLLSVAELDRTKIVKTSEIISRQVKYMANLVDDLMDVSRVTRGLINLDSADIDIKQVVTEAIEQVSAAIESKRHNLTLKLTQEPAHVWGDAKRLVQVITNVLDNSIKYTPAGGDIHVQVEVEGSDIVVDVADNGIGIATELQPYVFDLFTQGKRNADRSQGGLGIGLALVKSLVTLNGGHITCKSEGNGKGSQFTIILPRYAKQQPANQGASFQPATKAIRKQRLLVVDDNIDAAQMLGMYLQAVGHEVLIEHSSKAALERARIEKPDACVLDIGLPDMDGYELARQLRMQEETAHARLIALTGYGQEQDKKKAYEAGFDGHLVKPVNTADLVALIGRLLN
jgi:signal transduction histidine kinase